MPSPSAIIPFLGPNYVPPKALVKDLPVPDDVLSEIFIECSPNEADCGPMETEGWPVPERQEAVGGTRCPSVDLSHVCRRWRRVALGTPRLWVQADIFIPNFPDSAGRVRRLTHLVRTLTQRSGARPLSFKVKVSRGNRAISTAPFGQILLFKESIQELVDALCVSSARWRRFSLSGNFNGETHTISLTKLFAALAGPLPALSYVFIDAEFASQRHPTRMIRPLTNTPTLQSVTILQPYGLLNDLPVAAWSCLKSLTLGSWKGAPGGGLGMHSHTALYLLKSLNSLVYLDMHMDHIAPSEAEEDSLADIAAEGRRPVISLPYLRSLSLKGAAVAPGFATVLTLPTLESLSFTSLRIMHRERQEAGLLECLTCFGCQITRLELDMVDFRVPFVLACAESLTQVRTLKIGELPPRKRNEHHEAADRYMDFYRNTQIGPASSPYICPTCLMVSFLEHLTSPVPNFKPKEYRAPNLQNISLSCQTNLQGVEKAIVQLVLARSGPSAVHHNVQPLKVVSCHLGGSHNIDIRRQLATGGVDLKSLDFQLVYSAFPSTVHPYVGFNLPAGFPQW
ncbi:hypothetical protein DFP72DRAFT_1040411 [Ephemerocybe angulata]|uniref:F-box domain-containing protein n=1 Tax=Ephemerocybe angulata TaxID=980116 RepID=A0A8H6IFX1_9AGAR|nr:hypothetical protein DFP72DRAFT_1040411 [Tulosesus angulatus]